MSGPSMIFPAEEPIPNPRNTHYHDDWETIPRRIRCFREDVPLKPFRHPCFQVPLHAVSTMDAYSKSFKFVGFNDDSFLVDASDGITWAIVDKCENGLSHFSLQTHYFFHAFRDCATNLLHYVVPTQEVKPTEDRHSGKSVRGLVYKHPKQRVGFDRLSSYAENTQEEIDAMLDICASTPTTEAQPRLPTPPSSQLQRNKRKRFDMMSILRGTDRGEDCETSQTVFPVKIRTAFTGVSFVRVDVDGEGNEERKTCVQNFSIIFVTFPRNFDALKFIVEEFLKGTRMHHEAAFVDEMREIWRKIVRHVACENYGITATNIADSYEDCHTPADTLGRDNLMNVFQIPYQIFGNILRTEEGIKLPGYTDMYIEELHIDGIPDLVFGVQEINDEDTPDKRYNDFMYEHVKSMSDHRAELDDLIIKYNIMMSKKNKGGFKQKKKRKSNNSQNSDEDSTDDQIEEAEPEEEDPSQWKLKCIGGWPLSIIDDPGRPREYTMWGLPPFRLVFDFKPEFTVRTSSNFGNWLVNSGGINILPVIVRVVLQYFRISVGTEISAGLEDADQYWGQFLRDSRKADAVRIWNAYYSPDNNPLSALMMPGHLRSWWSEIRKFMAQVQCAAEPDDFTEQARTCLLRDTRFKKYLMIVNINHTSALDNDAYQSNRVRQGNKIVRTMDWDAVACEGPKSIRARFNKTRERINHAERHDEYHVMNIVFWRAWTELNESYSFHANNLALFMEIMSSSVAWMLGDKNDTWVSFFQVVMVKGCNGHNKVKTGLSDTVTDHRKPNSSGMDFVFSKYISFVQSFMDKMGVQGSEHNFQTPLNLQSTTPAAIPLICSVTHSNDQILAVPPPDNYMRDVFFPEVRHEIDPLIQNTPRNADDSANCRLNTFDANNTNNRQCRNQEKMSSLFILGFATNVLPNSPQTAEQYRSYSLVCAVLPSGQPVYNNKKLIGKFNNQSHDNSSGRSSSSEKTDSLTNLFVASGIWTSCFAGLINKSAALLWELDPVTITFLDWIFFYVKAHVSGILDAVILDSFARVRMGYESRQIAKSVWTSAMLAMSKHKNRNDALQELILSLHYSVMPIEEVPAAAHSFLCRGIDMGVAIIIAVIQRHLKVPEIPVQDLIHFFESDTVPTEDGPALECYNNIRRWIVDSHRNNCFCSENNEGLARPVAYITSPATSENNPVGLKTILRVYKQKCLPETLPLQVGSNIHRHMGSELFQSTHMGPEESVFANAVNTMTTVWRMDFRQLFGNHIYATKKHLTKLKLLNLMPSEKDLDSESKVLFAKPFVFVDTINPTNQAMEGALGINIWGLLLMTSLGLTQLHTNIVNTCSKRILSRILQFSPKGVTPFRTCMVRSFNQNNSVVEGIPVSHQNRPRHFPRPCHDESFINSGKFTNHRDTQQFMPEDVLHCGFLFAMRETLNCPSILCIPGEAVVNEYHIMQDTHYPIWNPTSRIVADFVFRRSSMLFVVTMHGGERLEAEVDMSKQWSKYLSQTGFIMLPLITRAGACVKLNMMVDDKVKVVLGLLVFDPVRKTLYDHTSLSYHYISAPDKTRCQLGMLDTLMNLVPCGQRLYLSVDSEAIKSLEDVVPPSEVLAHKTHVQVLLNVSPYTDDDEPLEKVFVTYTVKARRAIMSTERKSKTVAVDVWELQIENPGKDKVVLDLVPPAPSSS